MTEPSEAWLDWHFKTQLLTYMEEDLPAACLSDRVIMAKWIQVLKAAPASQKMARNSLMLLMHGHLEDFGFLRAPFTDVNNCNRDLNQVVNGYHGISLLKPLKNARPKGNNPENKGPQRVAGGRAAYRSSSLNRIPRRSKLEPIAEITEPSSIAYSSEEIGIERDRPRTPMRPASTTVKQKIQAIEKELAINKPTPNRDYSTRRSPHPSCRNDAKASPNSRDVNRLSQEPHCQSRVPRSDSPYAVRKLTPPLQVRSTHNVGKCSHQSNCYRANCPNQDPDSQRWEPSFSCSHVVQNLKNCFQEVSDRLVDISKGDKPVLGRIRATATPPKSPKRISQRGKCPSQEVLVSKTRIAGGQSIPLSYQRDKTVMDLLRRQEELRRECLEYYNLDGTLKDELPVPTSIPKSKIVGFSIGACRALKRMKRWRGQPNQLKFFRTIFRGCGIKSDVTGRVKALDRRFERVALLWLRSKRRCHASGSKVEKEQPQSLDQLLEKQAYKTQYLAHVGEIRKLCEIHCRGVVPPAILEKMYRCLDKEYEAAYGDLEKLEHQLDAMGSC